MLNLLENNRKNTETKKITISDIEKFYFNQKSYKKSRFGLEYERLSLDKDTYKNASYEKLKEIIQIFCSKTGWQKVYDNNTLIGAKNNTGSSLSLEPGCQLEISLEPKRDILSIQKDLFRIIDILDYIALKFNVIFLGYGISPVSCVDEIKLLNKRRYQSMDKYLPYCYYGELAQKMMRQTAGIQVNIDYFDQKDAYNKLKFLNLIMPFVNGLCANSPFENSSITKNNSIRSNVWRYTGANRCNIFYKKAFDGVLASNNIIKNYIMSVLDVPMIFIERNGQIIEINGEITFREFMKDGFLNYFPTIDDYILHQSLCFPDVRLKKYIEIRNHDSASPLMALALCAFYKGLMEEKFEKLLLEFNYLKLDEIDKYCEEINKNGLNFVLNKQIAGWKVVLELFEISRKNLNSQERSYLEPILKILKSQKTNADHIKREVVDIVGFNDFFIKKY